MSVDFVLPRAHNGKKDPKNLVAACRPCNRIKGRRSSPILTKLRSIFSSAVWSFEKNGSLTWLDHEVNPRALRLTLEIKQQIRGGARAQKLAPMYRYPSPFSM